MPKPPKIAAGPAGPSSAPTWVLIVGSLFGGATLLFLMVLAFISVLSDITIPCAATFTISLIFGLCLGLASAFLGGYANAKGEISIPVSQLNQPIVVGLGGGILFLVIGSLLSHHLIEKTACAQEQAGIFKGEIENIPGKLTVQATDPTFFYIDENHFGKKRCESITVTNKEGEQQNDVKCDPYRYKFAIDKRLDEDISINFINDKSEIVCAIRIRHGSEPPRASGEDPIPEIKGKIDYNANRHIKFEMHNITDLGRYAADGQIPCYTFEVGGITHVYHVKKNRSRISAPWIGIKDKKVYLRKIESVSSRERTNIFASLVGKNTRINRNIEGRSKLTYDNEERSRIFRTQYAEKDKGNFEDDLKTLFSKDPVIASLGKQFFVMNFKKYESNIWPLINKNQTNDNLAILINLVNLALQLDQRGNSQEDNSSGNIPREQMKFIVRQTVMSDSVNVRDQARKFIRSHPSDAIALEFENVTTFVPTEENANCTQEMLFKCRRAAYASLAFYYNRMVKIILDGKSKLSKEKIAFAEEEFRKSKRYWPFLADSASIDKILPIYGFAIIWDWGDSLGIIPEEVSDKYRTIDLMKDIVREASNSDSFYPYPHHIYSAFAASKNDDPSLFSKLLIKTKYGSIPKDFPENREFEIKHNKSDQSVLFHSVPNFERNENSDSDYATFHFTKPIRVLVLSEFNEWKFVKFRGQEDSFEFGWINIL